jgi:hypothetical protein
MKVSRNHIFLLGFLLIVCTEPALAASLKSKIETFTRNLSTIGIAVGVGSCVISGLALQSQYRGALIWFRGSVIGTGIVILAPVIINTVAQAIR